MAPRITAVENIYQARPTTNGASPFWCFGSSTLVAAPNGDLFITSYEKTDEAIPYQNVKWALWKRSPSSGWQKIHQDDRRTREPSPMVILPNQNTALISTNPTLTAPDVQAGPADPQPLSFKLDSPTTLTRETYVFPPDHSYCEHTYRSLVADSASNQILEFHQVDFDGTQVWSLRDPSGQWGHPGLIPFPWGADYATPQSIRICYPSVLLHKQAAYYCGVSDIMEPNPAWREAKFKITGVQWDYDFRRLFFTWTPDITTTAFNPWIEVSSRESTCGWILPCDMIVNPDTPNSVTVLWFERALDERIRAEFYPNEKQSWSLNTATITAGKVVSTTRLTHMEEPLSGPTARFGRFHQTPDGRRFVLAAIGNPNALATEPEKNQSSLSLIELSPDNTVKSTHSLGHTVAHQLFFVASPRAGNHLSNTIHVLAQGPDQWIQYIKIDL
jgi:hypothetical protein